jgi:WD40 repeat protein
MSFGQLELSVQKGHSDEVIQIEFSKNNKYLVSLAKNNELIIWDLPLEKSISYIKLGEIEIIEGLKFSDDEKQLKIKSARTTFVYHINSSKLTDTGHLSDEPFRKKNYYFDTKDNYETYIYKGTIKKKKKDKLIRRYKKSVSYANVPFIAFDIDKKHNKLIAVAENNMIFVYNYTTGIKLKEIKAHNSRINDIRFSDDKKYFATTGKDRSIIIWNTETLTIEKRLFSNIYQKKTAVFSAEGNNLIIADELGNVYQINLTGDFPSILSKSYLHSVNKILVENYNNKNQYFIATGSNYIYQQNNIFDKRPIKKYPLVRLAPITHSREYLIENVFQAYQEPFGQITSIDIDKNHKNIAYTGQSENPHIVYANLNSNKKFFLRIPYDYKQWTDVDLINENEIISTFDSTNVIYYWKIKDKQIYLKTDTLPYVVKNFDVINDNEIWLNTKYKGQFIYNKKSRHLKQTIKQEADEVFIHNNLALIATSSHSIVIYNMNKEVVYHTFMGHKEQITDINIHPNQNLMVSSSNDGSVKLWNIKQKKLIVSIFPFKDDEFIFINPSNYYLSTKGALEEIGFKYKGQYFLAEQFDIKFNRPDIILKELGYTDTLLISAYKKAYKKRLKKLNFTENQLNIDFVLPEVEIVNATQIPKEIDNNKLELSLKLNDKKHNLDRLNVWVNDVAIYGTNGINLKDLETKELSKNISINLLPGKNKIQISVLNQSGAESFKQTLNVISTVKNTKPNLYIVSIGVSKHKDQRYDLNYADKDAKDFAQTFNKSNIYNTINSLVLVNDEVTVTGLQQIKPFLSKAKVNDVVMLFVAGHGVLDNDFNYYFASYDMNFNKPAQKGIPYEMIEQLLDGIKPLKKLLLIDTCHSGELDKEEVEETDDAEDSENGDLIFRAVGKNVAVKDNPLGLKSTNELMKSLFTDLRKGTGATVISSSGGAEYSLEGGEFQNGLFTYCLLQGLLHKKADLNKDKIITVSEIQKYVSDEVSKLSNGLQTPTSRIKNKELDFRVW